MKWGAPEILPWLWLMLPLAWVTFKLLRRRERLLAQVAAQATWAVIAPRRAPSRSRWKNGLWLAALASCGLALARPQWGFHWKEVKQRGLDIMVVLDTSRSMLAQDLKPNRFQQAIWGIRDLVKELKGDRIGLRLFAGSSFLQCPLTIDYAAFMMMLEDAYVGIIPEGGTAVYGALRETAEDFDERTDADKAIVLLTDGEDHTAEFDATVELLNQRDIRVYVVGVGTLQGELIPVEDEEGRTTFLKDREGRVVKSALHENELEQLALSTSGMYVRSAPGDFGLARIYDQGIAELQRGEKESRLVKVHEERFMWALAAALLLLAQEAILADRGRAQRRS